MRVVFELKRDAIPNVVLNKLYKYTQLQPASRSTTSPWSRGVPMLNLKEMLFHYIEHRHDVIVAQHPV